MSNTNVSFVTYCPNLCKHLFNHTLVNPTIETTVAIVASVVETTWDQQVVLFQKHYGP